MNLRLSFVRYGAFELKQAYQRNLGLALIIAGLIHMIVIFGFLLYGQTTAKPIDTSKPKPPTGACDTIEYFPPPPITFVDVITSIPVIGPDDPKPTIGIPEPVPDREAPEGATIASQSELNQIIASNLKGIVEGTGEPIFFKIEQPEILPQPEEFVPYDEPPVPLNEGTYEYPPLAKQAGIEGTVSIKALVDKNGNVRDAFVFKASGCDLGFEKEALEAAFKIKYKPAISNNEPVAVWVVYPVCFKLK
jgi:TonB family protein